MADDFRPRGRYGEAFWRAHHEAWRRSELNQREYCEAQGIPLKAFSNWRAMFKAEPQPPTLRIGAAVQDAMPWPRPFEKWPSENPIVNPAT